VKRIRPDALGPFDYTKENHTKLLWVAEGITEYYGQLMLRRAGLISDDAYLAHIASQIQDMQETPGREVMSAEDASFNAWIKEYRPDENSINSEISYYDKGELLGMLLDLEIRRRSNNAKSLDDVMRMLYTDFFKRNRNYSPTDFQKVCETAAGSSLEEFFAVTSVAPMSFLTMKYCKLRVCRWNKPAFQSNSLTTWEILLDRPILALNLKTAPALFPSKTCALVRRLMNRDLTPKT
jgi:predicted metalloprotease with PDZ domain